MKAVIVSSSYSYLERIELLKECYEKKGYETTVLLTDFVHSSKSYVNEERDGYEYIHTKPYKKNISIQRLYSHYRFAQDAFSKLRNMQVDLLHVLLPANSLAKVAKKYKKQFPHIKLCMDIIDLWPETMPIKHLKKLYPFQVWKHLRDNNLDNADVIYCECELFQRVMHREEDPRFRILYWVKRDEPAASTPKLIDDKLQLCYLGSINNVIDIEYMVQMCKKLSEDYEVVLHIIGDGEKRDELIQKLDTTKANIIYHGLIYDAKQKQAIFDQCHFGLNIMKPSVCVGLTMKSLDYFQAGLPLINNIEGDTAELIKEYHIGYNGYDNICLNDCMSMREHVKQLYQEKFTKNAFVQQLDI